MATPSPVSKPVRVPLFTCPSMPGSLARSLPSIPRMKPPVWPNCEEKPAAPSISGTAMATPGTRLRSAATWS